MTVCLIPPTLAVHWDGDLAVLSDLDLAVWASVVGHPLGGHDARLREGALRALAWGEIGEEIVARQVGRRIGTPPVCEATVALLDLLRDV